MSAIPRVIADVFTPAQRKFLLREVASTPNSLMDWDETRSRMVCRWDQYQKFALMLLPLARSTFGSDTLLPSYTMWARYIGERAYLERHKDTNACTYTLDYCVNLFQPWPLFVEGNEYVLRENQALAFLGEDQEHWRGDWITGNIVEMMFFHYVEPDHWWFTGEGGRYASGSM